MAKREKTRFRRPFSSKKKVCRFCENQVREIDYKEVNILRKYILEKGKITPRRMNGNCAYHQRKLSKAIKKARHLALLPYIED